MAAGRQVMWLNVEVASRLPSPVHYKLDKAGVPQLPRFPLTSPPAPPHSSAYSYSLILL